MTYKDKAKDLADNMAHRAKKAADNVAKKAGPLAEKAKPLAEKAKPLKERAKPLAEKAAPLAEKAGHLAAKGASATASKLDRATHGKYHDKIENVSGKVGKVLNRDGRSSPSSPADDEAGQS